MIAIGCDHGGFTLKNVIIEHLKERGIDVKDFGCYNGEAVNYPDIAEVVCESVVSGESRLAILCCGSGIGMSMAANKIKGIRAAACSETFSAEFTRRHNNANVLCLGGRVIGPGVANQMVDLFVDTEFEGGRHQTRVDMITEIENKNCK